MPVYPCGDVTSLFLDGWLHGDGNLPPNVRPLGVRSIQYSLKPSLADRLSIWVGREAVSSWCIGHMINDGAG